jgi:protein-S-isoprenylcysteine O-methyltransferase Ste14
MESSSTTINRHGITGVARDIARTLFHLIVLLGAAGNIRWLNAWACIGVAMVHQIVHPIVLMRVNPQVLNERGKLIREDTKRFDRVFVVLYVMIAVATSAVAGLDAGRAGWPAMPPSAMILGAAMHLTSTALSTWAMAVNAHFEMTMRIQDDRQHRVCTSGPYRIVRHPGYAAMLIGSIGYPLFLGSWWALIPGAAMIALFVVRTALEDCALQEELPGYKDYAAVTQYRLVPGVW